MDERDYRILFDALEFPERPNRDVLKGASLPIGTFDFDASAEILALCAAIESNEDDGWTSMTVA